VTTLFDSKEISRRIEKLASTIADKISGDLLVIGLLKGSFVFTADLVRALDRAGLTPQIEFMRASSYGNNMESSGEVRISCDISADIAGRQVLLVDDIVDTGRSMLSISNLLKERGAARVWTCTLLDKPSRRQVDFTADFTGFSIEDVFVVGYGIDYAENYRHLPFIGFVEQTGAAENPKR
jgi:hypoxanthine phosphoribosyltransferase